LNPDHRRVAFLLIALASLALVARPASASSSTIRIRQVDQTAFPTVTVTVSVGSSAAITAADVRLTENGTAVSSVSVQPYAESGSQVDVVLVLDTSDSVRGAPLASALVAARQFVTGLPPGIGVGVLTFADRPHIAVATSPDHQAALAALENLLTTRGTSIYDAVVAAAGMFTREAQRNIILLTDGADTTSKANLASAIAAAKDAQASISTVGLASGSIDEVPLRAMASETGGTYAPAEQADLSSIYQGLATQLSNQYLITYRSTSAAGVQVTLSVAIGGASDSATILTVSVPSAPAPAGPAKAASQPLLGGTWGFAVALGLAFIAVFVLLVMLLGAGARTRRDRELARRMALEQVPASELPDRPDRNLTAWIPEPFVQAAARMAEAGGFAGELDKKLERAGLSLRAGEFLVGSVGAAVLGAMVGAFLLQSIWFALMIAAVSAAVPSLVLKLTLTRRMNRMHEQLADVLQILASSLRAGHSFFQALDMVAKEIGEPTGPEFARVVAEVRLGRPVDEAMNAMAERVGSDDFKWAVLAVNIQREVGGNLAEILDTVAETVRERDAVRRQIQVLSAEGRLSINILIGLPFLIALWIAKVNPGYLNLLFSTTIGWVMIATAGCLMALGIVWARKVVKIDV
jgi:tight adherence protein B